MLKQNATVWQQKSNTEDIGGLDMCSEWNPPGKRKQGRPKMTVRKTFKETLKRWNRHLERQREKQNREFHGEKGMVALSLMDRCNERRR